MEPRVFLELQLRWYREDRQRLERVPPRLISVMRERKQLLDERIASVEKRLGVQLSDSDSSQVGEFLGVNRWHLP
jgi:hypothetical protein